MKCYACLRGRLLSKEKTHEVREAVTAVNGTLLCEKHVEYGSQAFG